MDVDVLLDTLIEDKHIGEEDREIAKICLLLINYGWKDKDKIKEQVNISDEEFEKYWKNLEKNGYFLEDGKVSIGMGCGIIEFLIMILVAKGFVEFVGG